MIRSLSVFAILLACTLGGCIKQDDQLGEMNLPLIETGPEDLLGKPAPDLQLQQLGGEEFVLSKQAGEKVVMLDFWATWCGPCVAEMPILAEVAGEYESKGVVFRAVNLRESEAEIKSFLDEEKLNVTAVRDTDGAVADRYFVSGIPTLVLIDKQGIVQSVHVGYNPEIGDQLRKELDTLLAGNSLVETVAESTPPARDVEEPAGAAANEAVDPAGPAAGETP